MSCGVRGHDDQGMGYSLGSVCDENCDKEEEWELVATKAEGWLKKQSLPSDLTLELQLRDRVHSEEKHVKSTRDFQLIYHLHSDTKY